MRDSRMVSKAGRNPPLACATFRVLVRHTASSQRDWEAFKHKHVDMLVGVFIVRKLDG